MSIIAGEKVAIPPRGHHRPILDFHIANINKPRLKLFEVEVNVNKVFAVVSGLGDNKLKGLLIPAFANPAHVCKFPGFHTDALPPKHNIIAVDILMNKRMEGGDIFIFQLKEALRIDVSVISIKMEAVNFFILTQSLPDET